MDRLRALGVEGVPALLERLPAAEDPQRAAILRFLSWSVYDWRDDAVGPAVCRALLPVIGTAEDELGYVADALARGAPASRAVVHDLAEMWTRGTPRVSDAAEDVLWRLGPDAAPVAPLALAAMLDSIPSSPTEDPDSDDGTRSSSRFARALSLLTATGADDPEVVAALRRLLAPGANQFARARVADVFRTWNDKAAAAVPDLLAMLHEHVWTEAAHGTASRHAALAALVALCAMPSADEVVWEEVQRAFRRGDAWTRNWDAVATLAGNPALEDRLAALATSLPPEAGGPILCRLFESCAHTQVALTPAMVRYPVAWARHGALRAWIDPDEMRPLPACTAELLDDEDAPVRARAALVLAIHGGASAESIRDAALSVVRPVTDAAGTYWWGDAEACGEAISTLGLLADRDPAALEWFVSDLESDRPLCSLRHAASVLARTGDALDGDHPKALARLHDGLLADPERAEVASIVGAMLRLGGGAEALTEACEQRLKSRTTLGALRAWAFGIARRAGPRAAVLRPVLLRMRAGAEAGEASEIDGALASIEEDPEGIARTWDAREPAVRRLIALGPAGRRALVLLVGRASRIDDVLPLLEGVPMEDAVRAVVRATSPGPTLDLRRLGAVRLAYRLPAPEALAIWTETLDASRAMVPGYARESLRADVHQSATTLEMRAPGSLPVELVRTLLDGDPPAPLACRLAGLLGPSAADLVPALRKVRDGDRWGPALSASVALWRITRSADEALASIDRVLPSVRYGLTVGDEGFWDVQDEDAWAEIASTFAEMPPDRRLLDTLLGVLRRPVNAEGAIVPLLEPFGADAAPAVPALRRMLFTHYADENHYAPECDLPAVRALGTIGPAARDALPDLRRWLTEHRRDRRRARAAYEAIRRIEAAPK